MVGMDREQSHLYLVFIAVLLGEEKLRTSQVMLSDCLPSALTSLPLNDPDFVSSPLIAMFETLASDNASPRPLVVMHPLHVPALHLRLFRQRPTVRLIVAYLASREASMKGLPFHNGRHTRYERVSHPSHLIRVVHNISLMCP